MRPVFNKKTFAIGATIVLIAAGGTYFLRSQPPLDPDSEYMKRVHQVSESARPAKVADVYSYDLESPDIAARESKKCRRCHGDMLEKVDGKPKYPIHFAMMSPTNAPNSKAGKSVLKLECVNCHKKVDLGKRGPDKAIFRVDRSKCTLCHELKQKERDKIPDDESKPGAETIGARNIMANHGANQEEGLAWINNHRDVAGVIGAVVCRECHAFDTELDICNECHEGWHGENWKGRHVKSAKELGVERCAQCHVPKSKMDICSKRCHGKNPLDG